MKALYIFLLLSVVVINVKAQLAVIKDTQGYVNLREQPSIKSKIVGRLNTNTIISYDEEESQHEWHKVYYSALNTVFFSPAENIMYQSNLHKQVPEAFVHSSHIVQIEKLPHAIYKNGVGYYCKYPTASTIDTIQLILKTRLFNRKNHKISTSTEGNWVNKIDGRRPWGVDGDLPKIEIYALHITINGRLVQIPLRSYSDLFQPNISHIKIHYDSERIIYIYMPGNSDGAGSYDVVWVIKNGMLIKRVIDNLEV